jgi:hypothetical protein
MHCVLLHEHEHGNYLNGMTPCKKFHQLAADNNNNNNKCVSSCIMASSFVWPIANVHNWEQNEQLLQGLFCFPAFSLAVHGSRIIIAAFFSSLSLCSAPLRHWARPCLPSTAVESFSSQIRVCCCRRRFVTFFFPTGLCRHTSRNTLTRSHYTVFFFLISSSAVCLCVCVQSK